LPFARTFSIALLLFAACGDDAPTPVDLGPRDFGPEPLFAYLFAPSMAFVGESVVLNATASTGGVRYRFDLGDGREVEDDDGAVDASWDTPGRYSVVVTVEGPEGGTRTAGAVIAVTERPRHTPRQSGTLARTGDGRFAVVEPDADLVTVATLNAIGELALERRIPTPDEPRTISTHRRDGREWLVVTCRDAVLLVSPGGADRTVVSMPPNTRPHAALALGDSLWVTLQGTGELAEVSLESATLLRRVPVIADARALAVLPDDRLAVSRWRSPDSGAEIALFDPATDAVEVVTLRVDPQAGSDTESGGVPSYLDSILVSPIGDRILIPSLQANYAEGAFLTGTELRSDTTVRAVISTLVLTDDGWVERFESRRQLDNRGLLSAGTLSSRGDILFVAARGARVVDRIDELGESAAGTILGIGHAPDGLALDGSGRFLVVHASLDRRLEVYGVSDFSALPLVVSTLETVESEPLDPQVLEGKRLFNDSADPRLGRDGYMACAHCHLEGDSDHRVWDFTQRGEGLRRTPPLFGRMGAPPFHWTANFDELHDFENDIRLHFDGTGLMTDGDFEATADPLGPPKAGRSESLDALVAYLETLDTHLPSPELVDGALSEAAERGEAVFASAGCPTCHAAPSFTDSALVGGEPILHDVGTISEQSGARIGEPLTGLDTPTLRGLWHQDRYLHDGSAASLMDVLTTRNEGDTHGTTSTLTEDELADLVAYLRSL
jgi:hypothetical protein